MCQDVFKCGQLCPTQCVSAVCVCVCVCGPLCMPIRERAGVFVCVCVCVCCGVQLCDFAMAVSSVDVSSIDIVCLLVA